MVNIVGAEMFSGQSSHAYENSKHRMPTIIYGRNIDSLQYASKLQLTLLLELIGGSEFWGTVGRFARLHQDDGEDGAVGDLERKEAAAS